MRAGRALGRREFNSLRLLLESKSRGIFRFLVLPLRIGVLMACVGSGYAKSSEDQAFRKSLDPLAYDYIFLEIGRNYPQAFSTTSLRTGGYHPILGYRFNLGGEWLMGVGGQFKTFRRYENPGTVLENKNFALWTLYHEGLYVLRLDHPTYMLLGPKFLYLLPAKAAVLPLEKDDSYAVEIGGAFSVSLIRILSNRSFLSLRVDRWRGTKTMKLQGLEFSLGYGWPLEYQ